MTHHPIRSPEAPAPRGCYSQAQRVGNLVFTSGLGPRDATTDALAEPTITAQTRQVMRNLEAVLEAGGAHLDDVVQVKVYLAELSRDFRDFDREYATWWTGDPPARTTVGADLLGILVELEAIAVVPDSEVTAASTRRDETKK